jgi:hypothetical protein
MRPAHIHFLIKAKGYRPLVTQVYDADCKYIDNDSVFGVKDSLIVKFTECSDKKRADTELEVSSPIPRYSRVPTGDTDMVQRHSTILRSRKTSSEDSRLMRKTSRLAVCRMRACDARLHDIMGQSLWVVPHFGGAFRLLRQHPV